MSPKISKARSKNDREYEDCIREMCSFLILHLCIKVVYQLILVTFLLALSGPLLASAYLALNFLKITGTT